MNSIRSLDRNQVDALFGFKGMQISLDRLNLESQSLVDEYHQNEQQG